VVSYYVLLCFLFFFLHEQDVVRASLCRTNVCFSYAGFFFWGERSVFFFSVVPLCVCEWETARVYGRRSPPQRRHQSHRSTTAHSPSSLFLCEWSLATTTAPPTPALWHPHKKKKKKPRESPSHNSSHTQTYTNTSRKTTHKESKPLRITRRGGGANGIASPLPPLLQRNTTVLLSQRYFPLLY
jgi:hypothetical protein